MIERYESKEISCLWNDDFKFKTYFEVELALLKSLEINQKIPKGTYDKFKNIKINPVRIKEIEEVTRHDVIAFCTSITEQVDSESSRFFHFGCTSSDIIDTATTLQIKHSLALIISQAKALQNTLWNKAIEAKDIICMGRSHGMNAEPMSFGQKFLSFYAEVSRRLEELENFFENEMTGQFSGAVGNYTILNSKIEKDALNDLKLKVEPVTSQVIPRDRIAKMTAIHSLFASALERIAVEIHHLHHSDIHEVYEGFSKGQKGSSTMPHKKNPISAENITGQARVIRSHFNIAAENIPLWHERDISHSSAERLFLPDNLGLLFYSIKRMNSTVQNLVILQENIEAKVLNNFTHLSSYVLHRVISEKNESREKIYALVQEASFNSKNGAEFLTKIENVFAMDFSQIKKMDLKALKIVYLSQIDEIFQRVKSAYPIK